MMRPKSVSFSVPNDEVTGRRRSRSASRPSIPQVFKEAFRESCDGKEGNAFFLQKIRGLTPTKEDSNKSGNELYYSISEYAKEKTCQKCSGLILKSGQDTTDYNAVPDRVTSVVHKMREQAQKRRDAQAREELDEILVRIDALVAKNADMFENTTPGVEAAVISSFKKKRPVNKKAITDKLIDSTENASEMNRELVAELNSWFSTTQQEWVSLTNTIHASPSFSASDYNLRNVAKLIKKFNEMTTRLEVLVKSKLSEAVRLAHDAEKRAELKPPEPPAAEEADVDEVESLDSISSSGSEDSLFHMTVESHIDEISKINHIPVHEKRKSSIPASKMSQALKRISQTLNLAKRVSKTKKLRKSFKNSRKKLALICNANEKRDKLLRELEKEIAIKDKKIESMKQMYETELKEYLDKVQQLAEKNAELSRTIQNMEDELTSAKDHYTEQINALLEQQQQTPVIQVSPVMREPSFDMVEPLPRAPSSYRSIRVSQSEMSVILPQPSSIEMELHETIRSLEQKLDTMTAKNKENETKRFGAEKKFTNLEQEFLQSRAQCEMKDTEIDDLKKQEEVSGMRITAILREKTHLEKKVSKLEQTLERIMMEKEAALEEEEPSPSPPESPSPPPTTTATIRQQKPSKPKVKPKKKLRDDAKMLKTVHNQILSRVNQEHEVELKMLREFIGNEQHRFQASLRRTHLDHTRQLENNRTLRASVLKRLHVFRTTAEKILKKGNATLPSCRYEETPSNVAAGGTLNERGVEQDFTESVTEILIDVERTLESVLLSRDMALKDLNVSKVMAEEDCRKTNVYVGEMEQKLAQQGDTIKAIRNDRTTLTNECKKLSFFNQQLQKEKTDSVVGKTAEKKKELIQNEPVRHSRAYAASSSKKSVMILEHLVQNNLLSEPDYKTAMEIVQHSSRLSNKHFALLVHSYVRFRKIKDLRESVTSIKQDRKQAQRFEKFMARAETRYRIASQNLIEQTAQIRKKREDLFLYLGKLYIKNNQDFLSIVPLSLPAEEEPPPSTKLEFAGRRKILPSRNGRNKALQDVVGTRIEVANEDATKSFWCMPSEVPKAVAITLPKIVDMDLNSWRNVQIQMKGRKGKCGLTLPPVATVY